MALGGAGLVLALVTVGTGALCWFSGSAVGRSVRRCPVHCFFEVDARGGRGAWESFISHLFLLFSFDRDSTLLVGRACTYYSTKIVTYGSRSQRWNERPSKYENNPINVRV